MTVTFKKSSANGEISAPPSKSFAHRALIMGAFTNESQINNIVLNDDVSATLYCLKNLGADVTIKGDTVFIGGLSREKVKENTVIDCRESGSTIRFLIPLCLTFGKKITLKGSKRLLERPLDEYEKLCKSKGFLFKKSQDGVTVCGNLDVGEYTLNGEISSQYITGILLVLSALDGKSVLNFSGRLMSKSYVDITLCVLESFGIKTEFKGNKITVYGGKLKENINYTVEGDCSNAAYVEAFGFLGGSVKVNGLKENTVQGDAVYKEFYNALKNGKREFSLENCPDLAPDMFALACLYKKVKFTGTNRLKFKESDRVSAMQEELIKFGAKVTAGDDFAVVECEKIKTPVKELFSHNDHRIVMALSFLCALTGGSISRAEAVNKSYPDFFNKISKLGVEFTKNDD